MPRRSVRCAALAASVSLAGCAPAGGQPPGAPTAPTTETSSPTQTPGEPASPRTTKAAPRVCGGYERPELSAGECGLVNSANLGLLNVGTCGTYAPQGGATAAVECRARGMGIFPVGQEPNVYVFGFANLQSLKDGFSSYATGRGIKEGDVQYPPAAGYWGFPADPPDVHRGQLLSQVLDGESLFIWTDWTELTWISAESSTTDVKTLYSWWGKGNK